MNPICKIPRYLSCLAVLIAFYAPTFAVIHRPSNQNQFSRIDSIVLDAIQNREVPGAVLLVWHNGHVMYRKAFGYRSLEPRRELMTADTIFDIASLTKVVATTTAVMQLVERGHIRVNDSVSKYIPGFAQNGKGDITIRELLTHHSGLPPNLDLNKQWHGRDAGYQLAYNVTPVFPPGSGFLYSDVNFIALSALVEKVSGMSLDKYCEENIFVPLRMSHTRFLPPAAWRNKIAPTQYDEEGHMLRGVVHDPTVRRMDGVSGQAGLFSTADDLSKFAVALLRGGPTLSLLMVEKMITPQQPPTSEALRGFGWDIDSPFSSNRGVLLPIGSFGHTGFTGTSVWIDPTTRTFIILLTNAVHPRGAGSAIALRSKIATAVASTLQLTVPEKEDLRWKSITGYNEAETASRRMNGRNGSVKLGIDVLEANDFDALKSSTTTQKIGLLTNQTGVDSSGRRTIDVLAQISGISLKAIFSPEHGVTGALDTTNLADSKDSMTGIPVYSVYGGTDASRRPSLDVLKQLDAIVIDIQDAGVRFYTYETTLGYFLEAAAKAGIRIIVLDRPNPITGSFIQGPVPDAGRQSFVNYDRIPERHGMTFGELAKMFNAEHNINAHLDVVAMEGWMRGDWFDATGLTWINTSPNLRSLTQNTLYPGVGLIEGTNISVGRGTDSPFEVVGAPWIKAREFSGYLNARNIAGVRFVPIRFIPTASNYTNQQCEGVNIILTNRNALDSPELGIELAAALHKLYPQQFELRKMIDLLLNQSAYDAIANGEDPRRISADWQDALDQFQKLREQYLIYQSH